MVRTSNTTTTNTTVKSKTTPADSLKMNNSIPPQSVADVFKINYPAVNTVMWEQVVVPAKKGSTNNYKAYFIFNDIKHWVTYDADGKWVESREQILPDQLPQNIFLAIKNRYPASQIELATTYKNIKSPGSYAAFIKPQANAQEMEVILLENGTFVK